MITPSSPLEILSRNFRSRRRLRRRKGQRPDVETQQRVYEEKLRRLEEQLSFEVEDCSTMLSAEERRRILAVDPRAPVSGKGCLRGFLFFHFFGALLLLL